MQRCAGVPEGGPDMVFLAYQAATSYQQLALAASTQQQYGKRVSRFLAAAATSGQEIVPAGQEIDLRGLFSTEFPVSRA